MSITRRRWLTTAVLLAAGDTARAATIGAAQEPPPVDAAFPRQPSDAVSEMVSVSHGNVARVRELLGRQPALAKAAWDWGFGDWEDALGAASHVGHREIAELLIRTGARPTIFSAAMLGQLDVVKAFVAAAPGVQRIAGPHSITLMAHARAGGPAAAPVVEYLTTLGDADQRPPNLPLTDEQRTMLGGTYTFGPGSTDRLIVADNKGTLTIRREGSGARGLFHRGSLEFQPVGAEAVRIVFAGEGANTTVTVRDPNVLVTARRVGGG